MIASSLALALLTQPALIAGFDISIYRPGIDRSVPTGTPYADLFGTGRGPLVGGHLGVSWPILTDLALTAQLSLTHFGDSAYAFVDDSADEGAAAGKTRSGGKTSIDIFPVSALIGARYTGLWKRLRVPLIPFAEGGPAYGIWLIGKGGGAEAASGSSTGLALRAGLLVELLGLEPHASRKLGEEFGVQSVALEASVLHLWLDGFGSAASLELSDTAWSFGLELGF